MEILQSWKCLEPLGKENQFGFKCMHMCVEGMKLIRTLSLTLGDPEGFVNHRAKMCAGTGLLYSPQPIQMPLPALLPCESRSSTHTEQRVDR